MPAPRATAAHASVVFLRIPDYAQTPVAEQVRLKDRLEGKVATALAGLDEARRVVLEAPDGCAVVVLGDPAAALRFARRAAAGEEGVRVAGGLSHGPVRVAEGGTTPIVLGDGIAAAQAVAGFATTGRVAATREFRDALERAAPSHAWHLAPAGTHSDARDRSYEIFLADQQAATSRRRRSFFSLGAVALAILATGFAIRMAREPAVQPRVAAAAKPAARPAPSAPPPVVAARPEPNTAPSATATLKLDIKPQGEIFVDGVSKGRSPPLASLSIPPGKHLIEIRRAGASPISLRVEAGPGEELMIRHSFAAPAPKSAWRKFFDQFK